MKPLQKVFDLLLWFFCCINLEQIFLKCSNFIAPIEMESLLKAKPIFSWQERATLEAPFLP
jgi:hypothetical protein